MPKIIDGQARREEIAEAVWAITAREGLGAATMRAVAAECGLSVGAVQHSFACQAALQQFAMELIVRRAADRLNAIGSASDAATPETITALLLNLLPLDRERELEARVWLAFFNAALTNDELAPYVAEIDALINAFCRACLAQLEGLSNGDERAPGRMIDPDSCALALHALLDGLTLHILADPSPEQRSEAERAVRSFVEEATR